MTALVLFAAGELSYSPPPAPAAPDPTGLLLRLVGITAAALLLCGVVLWLAKRVGRVGVAANGAGRIVHEGSLTLDGRCAVHLIRVDGQSVAVTTDASGLRSVVVLSEPFGDELKQAEERPEP